jgi:hypothetical protein
MTERARSLKANLPNFFSFKSANDLIRIGKKNDGGYLLSQSDINKSDVLISLGIGSDWSFEEKFVEKKNIEVFAYDASINQKYFFKEFIKSLILSVLFLRNPKTTIHYLKLFLSYKKFFSQRQNHHITKFVGLNTKNNTYSTLSSILDGKKHKNCFLKIDIEGSEYRLLNTLILNQDQMSGLVLELHDCDLHINVIKKFIQNFNLKLVHIHANNYAPIRLDDSLPLILELTFSKYCKVLSQTYLPHEFDMPNDKNRPEIHLKINPKIKK